MGWRTVVVQDLVVYSCLHLRCLGPPERIAAATNLPGKIPELIDKLVVVLSGRYNPLSIKCEGLILKKSAVVVLKEVILYSVGLLTFCKQDCTGCWSREKIVRHSHCNKNLVGQSELSLKTEKNESS